MKRKPILPGRMPGMGPSRRPFDRRPTTGQDSRWSLPRTSITVSGATCGASRPWGPISAAAFVLVAWALFVLTVWGRPWPEPFWDILINPDRIAVIQLAVAVTNTAFAIFWLFRVNPSWVKPVAEAYAAQLMGSVRTLRGN